MKLEILKKNTNKIVKYGKMNIFFYKFELFKSIGFVNINFIYFFI